MQWYRSLDHSSQRRGAPQRFDVFVVTAILKSGDNSENLEGGELIPPEFTSLVAVATTGLTRNRLRRREGRPQRNQSQWSARPPAYFSFANQGELFEAPPPDIRGWKGIVPRHRSRAPESLPR